MYALNIKLPFFLVAELAPLMAKSFSNIFVRNLCGQSFRGSEKHLVGHRRCAAQNHSEADARKDVDVVIALRDGFCR